MAETFPFLTNFYLQLPHGRANPWFPAPLVLSSASYLPSSEMVGSKAAPIKHLGKPYIRFLSYLCWCTYLACVWSVETLILHLSRGGYILPSEVSSLFFCYLLMFQASTVGSTLFPQQQVTHFKLLSGSVECFSQCFRWRVWQLTLPKKKKLPQGNGMGLSSIAFSKNPLLISTFNTSLLAKWLRMFRFTKLVSIISFANPSRWSHNSTCNVASIVLSPQLKLILKYLLNLFSIKNFSF